jgi:hypothetical protein
MPSTVSNALSWILEPFEDDPTYLRKKMFGCDAAYLDGLMCLVVADRDEPWNGLLVCTSHERHAALIADLPALQAHPTLGKWLYISQTHPDFEDTVARIAKLISARDERIGVEPKPKRRALKP